MEHFFGDALYIPPKLKVSVNNSALFIFTWSTLFWGLDHLKFHWLVTDIGEALEGKVFAIHIICR